MRVLLFPDEIEMSSPVGGKARSLAALQQADLPIPPWFVVLPSAFSISLTPQQELSLQAARDAEDIRAVVSGVVPSPVVVAAIREAISRVVNRLELAVRSSAIGEDSAEHSFAGQLESFLFVRPERVPEYVARIWQSAFSERLIAYRKESGLPLLPQAPAVIVQAMVEGDVSGIAFSADPVSGRRGMAVVAAAPGLGAAVVSGETNADTWRMDRTGRIVDADIMIKQVVQRRDTAAMEGISSYTLSGDDAARPALDEGQVAEVARLVRSTARFFGVPQDIEWTISGGQLYLLQSRPITVLSDKFDPDGIRAIWDSSNIAESYNGITTPFTFSFARRAYEHVYRQSSRLMGVDEALIEAKADTFSCMLGLVRGRVYYNLLNWYRLVAVLPGYVFNRKFMEQMMGVSVSLDDNAAISLDPPGTGERLRDGLKLLGTLLRLLLVYMGLSRRINRFYLRLADTLGSGRPDLSGLRPDELAAYYRQLEQRLLLHWDAPIANDFATMFFHGVLRKLAAIWVSDTKGTLHNDLLSAEHGMISTEPAERVRRMAGIAATSTSLVEVLCNGNLLAIRHEMRLHPQFSSEFDSYLERFGDRCMEELKLESPSLFDDPLPLLRSIGQYARNRFLHGDQHRSDTEATLRQEAEAVVRKALANRPVKRMIFSWVLASARARVRDRENMRFERTRVFGRVRLIAVEIGKRLVSLNRLDTPQDVFWLEVDEMLAFVEGRATTTDLKGLAALRKAEFERYRSDPAPADRFETHGIIYVGHDFQSQASYVPPSGEILQGLGCSAGIVRGQVRVIRDPRQANIASGEIIVAERTDPGWVMVFPAAAGLLVERGSLLSHSAIVAREIGLPTIVALTGVTQWLKDGDWVEMDGASGKVTRLSLPQMKEARNAAS